MDEKTCKVGYPTKDGFGKVTEISAHRLESYVERGFVRVTVDATGKIAKAPEPKKTTGSGGSD